MDIPRPKRPKHRALIWGGGAVLLALATLGMSQLKQAAPTVERASLLIDTAKRGDMLREVRAPGTLVPEDQRLVSALTAGRIERVLVRPGATATPATLLIEMSNPDVQLEALEAERQVKLAEADLASLRSTLETQRLAASASVASVKLEARNADRGVKVAERLAAEGLASEMETERARDAAEDANARYTSEQKRLEVVTQELDAQLALRRSEVDRLAAIARFQQSRVASMQVKAGGAGVVQELSLQPGQWVTPGQLLARVAGVDHLKAVILVPEAQSRDLKLGLSAVVDTHDGTIRGHVARVDPAVLNGTVAVDIALDDSLPKVARPDLSVDGTIQIERLHDVVYVGRPSEGSSEGPVSLFRLDRDGHGASRVAVQLGRGSASTVEVRSGLGPGDQVILSDMSRWEKATRVRIP